MDEDRGFKALTDRQQTYLRMVHDLCNTSEIAFNTGDSQSSIDSQLKKACRKLGVTSRVEAARRFHDYERRIQSLDPRGPDYESSSTSLLPLPWPLPSRAVPINMMTRQQVVSWAMIIAIGTPIGLTVAAMLIIAITFLLGAHE